MHGNPTFGYIGAGAWLVAARAEQRRRFKAVICAKPRDFETIRQERKRAEKDGTAIIPPAGFDEYETEEDTKILDGFFLVGTCYSFRCLVVNKFGLIRDKYF